jgi:rhamnopyranosyl-N-acetylglucosaminyl-diphospho-decaprenol beta-1,3/1,4-galactofuranosyltransferase
MSARETVVAVVVTYNRRDLVAETLRALLAQTRGLDAIVVVDNASTDGSGDVARDVAPGADLVRLSRNTGGAGGFTVGIERAISKHAADRVWVMDDDTVPTPTALEELLKVARRVPTAKLLASRVVWVDGRDHPMNTPRRRAVGADAMAKLTGLRAYPFRSASFVSLLIPTSGVAARGLPIADYFLWNDDFEFSTRLVRGGIGLLCERSVVEHRTKLFSDTEADPGARFYYEVRNKIWLFARSRSLGAAEKLVFIAATGARWTRTFVRSSDRRLLLDGLRRGTADALRRGPRSNAESLDGLGEVTRSIAAFEAVR